MKQQYQIIKIGYTEENTFYKIDTELRGKATWLNDLTIKANKTNIKKVERILRKDKVPFSEYELGEYYEEKWNDMICRFCNNILPNIQYMDAIRDDSDEWGTHYTSIRLPKNENVKYGGITTEDIKILVGKLEEQMNNDLMGPAFDGHVRLVNRPDCWLIGWNICEDYNDLEDYAKKLTYNWEINK